jgi:hypothetical protein
MLEDLSRNPGEVRLPLKAADSPSTVRRESRHCADHARYLVKSFARLTEPPSR